ncbi:hypothetical protein C1H46_015633 [Malus baccata]|uniref:O-fucosyltransferase family protein n=1 Tax=Malus baccata TaxID=106549 RepID=A0A540MIZ7_MALBA|nr:hypothetical protein C1H46_015633 [Malus baccata]
MNCVMLLRLQDHGIRSESGFSGNSSVSSVSVTIREKWRKIGKGKKAQKGNYGRMLALASHALAENGYILVTANGGMNQQRVAVCNAVAVARLLNSTLVVPKFLYSSIWRDVSQFGDIYQEEHFINYLTPDIRIVKELPKELQSLDLEAIGSVVTDVDISKEAKPSFYLKHIIPILLKNEIVHFLGFGHRLAFDPIPFQLQLDNKLWHPLIIYFYGIFYWIAINLPHIVSLSCLLACLPLFMSTLPNWGTSSRDFDADLDRFLVGSYAEPVKKQNKSRAKKASRYLALHLRFEIDMVAHSLCEFGGGDEERKELEAYREIHFPALTLLKKTKMLPTPAELREEGFCPLTPEETVLMLAALGFNWNTRVFVAGSQIYGGRSRMIALTSLYPELVTKENLLTLTELEPFMKFSSQLAALDFIGCTAADAFAMTDSGSQLSSLVSGFRIYYGGGKMPTIRPNKRRLSSIFMNNSTIEWRVFEQRIRKAVRQTKHIQPRPKARSMYRYPRCDECMCNMTISF